MIRYTLLLFTFFVISFASENIDFDINSAYKEANSSNKIVILFFHKDYCGYCSKMEENLESEKINKEIRKNFIFFSLNRDDGEVVSFQDFKGTTHAFAKALEINFYPTLFFIDGDGKIIYNIIGYRKEKEISTILKYISNRSYKKMDFESFLDELEFNQ